MRKKKDAIQRPVERVVMCKCGKNPATEPHTCPFQFDIHDDDKFQCTCCEDCTYECAMDV